MKKKWAIRIKKGQRDKASVELCYPLKPRQIYVVLSEDLDDYGMRSEATTWSRKKDAIALVEYDFEEVVAI